MVEESHDETVPRLVQITLTKDKDQYKVTFFDKAGVLATKYIPNPDHVVVVVDQYVRDLHAVT